MVFKSLNRLAPNYMSSKFIVRSYLFNSYNLRDSENKLAVPLPRTNYYRNSFCYSGTVLWNHRGPTQSVCVADCYFVVNVLDLPFASPIAIYR